MNRMRVVITAAASLNPYAVLFTRSIQQADPAIECELWRGGVSWRRLLGPDRPHILHVHWVELLYRHFAPLYIRLPFWLSTMSAMAAARLRGVKIVYTVHNVWQHESEGQSLYRLAHHILLRLASAVHVHNDAARDELVRSAGRTLPVVVIPHGSYVNWYPNECSRREARERLGLSAESFVYLSLGHMRAYKGREDLMRAFAGLAGEEEVLLLAGGVQQPDFEARLRGQAATDPRVRLFLDYVPDDDVQVFMNAADVAVLPYRQVTTSGTGILALSFGLPVVAPALGPFPELLGHGAGILYDPMKPEALAWGLRKARQADLAPMRQAAWAMAQGLDWEPIGQQLATLYRRTVEAG